MADARDVLLQRRRRGVGQPARRAREGLARRRRKGGAAVAQRQLAALALFLARGGALGTRLALALGAALVVGAAAASVCPLCRGEATRPIIQTNKQSAFTRYMIGTL